MTGKVLIYGANGYTGQLIVERAVAHGLRPILAGRSGSVTALAARFGLESRIFGLEADALARALADVEIVVNAAGPFIATAESVMTACISSGTHYIDITGEISTFLLAQRLAPDAETAGVMLMPGAGWDVVASDCLAAHLAQQLGSVESIMIALKHINGIPTQGTVRTAINLATDGLWVRRDGELENIQARMPSRMVDFADGEGEVKCVPVTMGDVVTASLSAGAATVEVFTMKMAGGLPEGGVESLPAGPTPEQRANSLALVYAEATSPSGASARARLDTRDSYGYSALAIVAILERMLKDGGKAGFQTPGAAYGPDLAVEIGAEIVDLEPGSAAKPFAAAAH